MAIQMHVAHLNYQIVKLFGANCASLQSNVSVSDPSTTGLGTVRPDHDSTNSSFVPTSDLQSNPPVGAAGANHLATVRMNAPTPTTNSLTAATAALPPSYSEAMLWPPTYSSLRIGDSRTCSNAAHHFDHGTSRSLSIVDRANDDRAMARSSTLHAIAEHAITLEPTVNGSWSSCVHLLTNPNHEHSNDNVVNDNEDGDDDNANDNQRHHHHRSAVNRSRMMTTATNLPLRSSVSCSLLLGQVVFVVHPLESLIKSHSKRPQSMLSTTSSFNRDSNQQTLKRSLTDEHVFRLMHQMSRQLKAKFKSLHNLKPFTTESAI